MIVSPKLVPVTFSIEINVSVPVVFGFAGQQIDIHAVVEGAIVGGIDPEAAGAAIQDVAASATIEFIAAIAAFQRVVPGFAEESIVTAEGVNRVAAVGADERLTAIRSVDSHAFDSLRCVAFPHCRSPAVSASPAADGHNLRRRRQPAVAASVNVS